MFPLGQMAATTAAFDAICDSGQEPAFFLEKHAKGDWGETDIEDSKLNDAAVSRHERIISTYKTLKGVKLYVITEADRSSTTILLPDEY